MTWATDSELKAHTYFKEVPLTRLQPLKLVGRWNQKQLPASFKGCELVRGASCLPAGGEMFRINQGASLKMPGKGTPLAQGKVSDALFFLLPSTYDRNRIVHSIPNVATLQIPIRPWWYV